MKLFKPKVDATNVCNQFYDKFILPPAIANIDPLSIYYGTVRKSIIEIDRSFSIVEEDRFIDEMTAIHFELFGLAWLHEAGEGSVAYQSGYTKAYLAGKKRKDIWEAMREYNQAIARSAAYGLNRLDAARLDKERLDKFALWDGPTLGPEFVARAANRLGTEKSWEDNRTRSFLVFTLCNRIGYDPSDEARFRLEAVLFGLYDGAKQFLSEVRVTH
jgi:hypothetical protein